MSRAIRAMLLGALLALSSGCDYFKPAQPEAPSGLITFVPNYSDPDSTLETIARSIADKGVTIGSVAYIGAYAESVTAGSLAGYRQFFSPSDIASWESYGHVVPDWGFDLERSFYSRFVRLRGDEFQCTWAKDPLNYDDVRAGEVILHRHYLVVTLATDGKRTSVLARGFADLRLLRFPDGAWRVVLWNDRRDDDPSADPNDPTFGGARLSTAP